jgi:hypothetical protein
VPLTEGSIVACVACTAGRAVGPDWAAINDNIVICAQDKRGKQGKDITVGGSV